MVSPLYPILLCPKKTGPFESNLTKTIKIKNNGDKIINNKVELTTSNILFKIAYIFKLILISPLTFLEIL
ncbi:hypothetical protein D3C73_987960 [compost metagenome]